MKHLPKHLRPRWRYIVVEFEWPPANELTRREIQQAIWQSARSLLGDPGSADAVMRLIRTSLGEGGGSIILKVRRGTVQESRAAIACLSRVEGVPVGVVVRGVSGTLRAAEEKYMNDPTDLSDEESVVFEESTHRAVSRGDGRVDLRTSGGPIGVTRLDLE